MRTRFVAIWLLVTAIIAGAAAWFAYGAGVATKVASSVPATGGATVPYPYYYHPWGFGFPFFGIFGFLFLLFILFLVFRGLFGFRRGWGYGYRHYGPGGQGGVPPFMEERLKEWHRQAHGETETKTP